MADPTPLKSDPTSSRAADPLADLVATIKNLHAAVVEASRNVVMKAIDAGTALNEAKAKVGHGRWLSWLKQNCGLSERRAQDYMKLATNRHKIEAKMKSAAIADLTLKEALRLAQDDDEQDKEDTGPVGKYEKAQATLIAKLRKLLPEDVEHAVNTTVEQLKEVAAAIKKPASKAA
jgi:hypothetical protein